MEAVFGRTMILIKEETTKKHEQSNTEKQGAVSDQ